jgi:GMP synthase-like glutamine amidotransferase
MTTDEPTQELHLAGAPAWGIQFHAEVTAAIVGDWLDSYSDDDDARAAGVDPISLGLETQREIERWNDVGRMIATRFAEFAAAAAAAP